MKEPEIESWDQLKPADYNPRKIESYAAEGLSNSLKEFGDISGIVWNKRTGNVVAGHQRLDQLRKMGAQIHQGKILLGEREFKIRVVDWPIGREKAANVAANNPHISGDWAENLPDVLGDILAEIGDQDYEALGFSGLDKVKFSANLDDITEDEAPEPPKNPVTKLGDVWTLGDHTLVCGDSRADASFRGVVADMLFTDPPYGVGYTGGAKKREALASDHVGTNIYQEALPTITSHCANHSPIYLWYADGHAAAAAAAAAAAGWVVVAQIIWAKNHAQFVTSAHYKGKHEPCFYGHRKGKPCAWYGNNNEVTLWEYDRAPKNEFHPTQKPVGLSARAIQNSSKPGDTVLDAFLGSGATLIGAEQTGRKCFGVELAPEYCDVIVERWTNLTNGKATKKSGYTGR
jgi:DNA modification methylase